MATSRKIVRYRCWVWGKEVFLETCTTDERGQIVHEECYALRVQLEYESSRRMRWEEKSPNPKGDREFLAGMLGH